jgi:hypothetical protein
MKSLNKLKTLKEKEEAKKTSKGFFSFVSDSFKSISHVVTGSKPIERSQEDKQCEEITKYATSLHTVLAEVSSKTDSILHHQKGTSLADENACWFPF